MIVRIDKIIILFMVVSAEVRNTDPGKLIDNSKLIHRFPKDQVLIKITKAFLNYITLIVNNSLLKLVECALFAKGGTLLFNNRNRFGMNVCLTTVFSCCL